MDYDCAPSPTDRADLAQLLAWPDATGIELAGVKPPSDDPPDNRRHFH